MHKIGKYEFLNKEQALEKIAKLGTATDDEGNEYPTHKHAVVLLGHLTLTEASYFEDGMPYEDAVLSDKYAVDVLWQGLEEHPYGWATYALEVENPKHSFAGVDNATNKI